MTTLSLAPSSLDRRGARLRRGSLSGASVRAILCCIRWPQGRIPMGLKREHEKILKTHGFERAGTLGEALERDEFEGLRVIYAITDPGKREIIYIGETEQGRNLRGRLNAHLKDREKINLIEKDSDLYVHVMVTEFLVLSDFEEVTGGLPACNKRKAIKFA